MPSGPVMASLCAILLRRKPAPPGTVWRGACYLFGDGAQAVALNEGVNVALAKAHCAPQANECDGFRFHRVFNAAYAEAKVKCCLRFG